MTALPRRLVCIDCTGRPATFHIMTPYGTADLCMKCAVMFGELMCPKKPQVVEPTDVIDDFLRQVPITFRGEVSCHNLNVEFDSENLSKVVEWAAYHTMCNDCVTRIFIRLGSVERPLNMGI